MAWGTEKETGLQRVQTCGGERTESLANSVSARIIRATILPMQECVSVVLGACEYPHQHRMATEGQVAQDVGCSGGLCWSHRIRHDSDMGEPHPKVKVVGGDGQCHEQGK